MRLTVLGSSASYAGPGQACSGHLASAGTSNVLMDCGNGVLSNLAAVHDPADIDAVIVTHEHIDHFGDLYALQALLRFAPDGPVDPIPLYLPPGGFELVGRILSDKGRLELDEAFIAHELSAGSTLDFDYFEITPHLVDHVDPTFALSVEERGTGRTLCYTSDTALGQAVEYAASGAHLLLAEATLPQKYAGSTPHMTPAEAGELAARVKAERLVLSHVWPTNDREVMAREAAAAFGGPVTVASELRSFNV